MFGMDVSKVKSRFSHKITVVFLDNMYLRVIVKMMKFHILI